MAEGAIIFLLKVVYFSIERWCTFGLTNTNEVLDLLVQLPPLKEQKLISDILDNVNYRINLYKSEKEDFVQVKKGLMEKLLTGKIRV